MSELKIEKPLGKTHTYTHRKHGHLRAVKKTNIDLSIKIQNHQLMIKLILTSTDDNTN